MIKKSTLANILGGFLFLGLHRARSRMLIPSAASLLRVRLLQLIAIVLLPTMLNGCASMYMSERIATREEPQSSKLFFLTAVEESYVISRWWEDDFESVSIKRSDLPAGCETARFYLNNSTQELKLLEPVVADWITEGQPLLPDDSYPPCSLLISYGAFSGPPELEGIEVNSSSGFIKKDDRKQRHPAVWVLTPVAAVAEGYAMVGAFWTLPVWGPMLYFNEKNKEKRREQYEKDFPQPVTACWNAIDDKVKDGWLYAASIKVTGFEWPPDSDNTYYQTTDAEPFSEDDTTSIDTRVVLRRSHLIFPSQVAEADVECGMQSGIVIEVKVTPLR